MKVKAKRGQFCARFVESRGLTHTQSISKRIFQCSHHVPVISEFPKKTNMNLAEKRAQVKIFILLFVDENNGENISIVIDPISPHF